MNHTDVTGMANSSPDSSSSPTNPPKSTPTNTSLREELKSIAYSSEVKPAGWQSTYVDETDRWDKYVFNLDDLEALLTAKTTEALIQANYYRNHEHQHEFLDLGDPCYCGSDNCNICKLCGEENHD